MEIRQQFTIDRPIETIWSALSDVRLVASCMPGAEIVSVSDDQSEVEGRIRAKVGPVAASFAGRGKITRDAAAHIGTITGSGMDQSNGSRMQVSLNYALAANENDSATTTTIVATVSLSGLLAQFSKGSLINDIAAHMTRDFATRLQQKLAREPEASPSADSNAGQSDEPAAINPLSLLLAVLWGKLASLFGRAKGNGAQ